MTVLLVVTERYLTSCCWWWLLATYCWVLNCLPDCPWCCCTLHHHSTLLQCPPSITVPTPASLAGTYLFKSVPVKKSTYTAMWVLLLTVLYASSSRIQLIPCSAVLYTAVAYASHLKSFLVWLQ